MPVQDKKTGRFVKGHSGNPRGKLPGTRNTLAALRRALEIAVTEHISVNRIRALIDSIYSRAMSGDMKAAKLLLDKLISNAGGDEQDVNNKRVEFHIVNATFAATKNANNSPVDSSPIIDVRVTDVP